MWRRYRSRGWGRRSRGGRSALPMTFAGAVFLVSALILLITWYMGYL